MNEQSVATSIRKIVVGLIVAEYGLMELKEFSRYDLKARTNFAITAIRKVQDYFLNHPDSKPEHREIFRKEFLKNEIYMISELLETVWGLSDDNLEQIINAIRQNTETN